MSMYIYVDVMHVLYVSIVLYLLYCIVLYCIEMVWYGMECMYVM